MIRRRLKFAAVLAVVVLALTGFSKGGKGGSHGGSSGGSDGGGGGCSSSEKDNGSYSGSRYNDSDDDDYSSSDGSSDGSYGESTPTATPGAGAQVISCVRTGKGRQKAVTYATVRVEAEPGATGTYEVDVTFMDAAGGVADYGDVDVTLTGGEAQTVRVPMNNPEDVSRVRDCEATASLAS